MYNDVNSLKAREQSLTDRIKEVHEDVKQIKWFLIEKNGAIIKQRGK